MVPTDAVLACLEWAAATAAAEGVVDDLPGEAMEVGGEVDGRPAGPHRRVCMVLPLHRGLRVGETGGVGGRRVV